MPLAAQIAKLLTKGAQDLMSFPTGAIMKHSPTLRELTPEQEAASFAPVRTSSYDTPEPTVADTPPTTPIDTPEINEVPPVRTEMDDLMSPAGGKGKGGVVDMRNGGKVGAAVVAASLMASGGQVMDMRNGGVVAMEQGGTLDKIQSWFTPDNEEAAINLVDATEPDTYQIKHMTGLSLDIFNKSYDRLIKSDLVDPGQRQQALENFDKFTQEVFKIESSENWTASHPAGASGGFQFKPDTIQPTINRLERLIKDRPLGSWTKDILKHKEASRLSPEQQRALFVTNMFERSLRDKKGKILKGEGDKLLIGTMKGDTGDMVDAYYKLHYAGDPDWKTRFRANTMLRFEKEGEDRIFNFAKQIKKLLN